MLTFPCYSKAVMFQGPGSNTGLLELLVSLLVAQVISVLFLEWVPSDMICIYDSVEIHDIISPSKVRRTFGAGGETVLLQQKSEVSAENISLRVRHCEKCAT